MRVLVPAFVYGTPTYDRGGRLVTIPCSRDEHGLCTGHYRAGATFWASCWCECHAIPVEEPLTGHLAEEAA